MNATKKQKRKWNDRDGMSITHKRLYQIYIHVIYRCYRKHFNGYQYYGGKGITVCDEWLNDFHKFAEWALNNGYKEDLTIDRIDSNKGYSPDNCRWVDYYTQEQNKGIKSTNTTGITGVAPFKGGQYRAYISRYGERTHLGVYDTLAEAIAARKAAERVLDKK